MTSFLSAPVPHTEAAAFIADKPVLAREAYDKLLPELKPRAMVITGIEDANVVQTVRDRIAALPRGADWSKVREEIANDVTPWLGDGAERRAEYLMRTHGFAAYDAAQTTVMQRQQAAFPYWQYLTVGDGKVRDSHRALDGLILPADSPFWDRLRDHGCRCNKAPITAAERERIAQEDATKKPEARRVLTPEAQKRLETSNVISRTQPGGVPREINVTTRGPSKWNASTLKIDPAELRARYDAPTWNHFENWARKQPLEDGRTVIDWLEGKPVVRPEPTASPVAPAVPSAPVAAPRKAPVSAALEVRTTGSHKPQINHALASVDKVHDDGELPPISLYGSTGDRSALGVYRFTRDGRAAQIGIANLPDKKGWPAMTTVHEVGHFLDHQVLGERGKFASHRAPALEGFRRAVAESAAVRSIESLPYYQQGYFLEGHELWARAYAQYIATRSGSPLLKAQLDTIRTSAQPWRQWSDEDFAPIATAIDDVLRAKGWLPEA